MAFAGTPTGLAQQAGTSHPWKALLAAIAVLAIGLAMVIAVLFVNSRAVAPTTGRSDAVVESQRDATLSGASAANTDAVEKAAAAKARAMSGVPVPEKVYQLDERPRGNRLDATSLDRIYKEIQSSRGAHGPLP